MTTSVRLAERVVRKALVAQIVVVAFQAFMPPTFEGFCITHIAGNADVSCGGVVSLLTLFGGGVGDGWARPPIFRVLPPTFRIVRWRSLSLILILAAIWFSTGGRSAVDLGTLTFSVLGRHSRVCSRVGALVLGGGGISFIEKDFL